MAKSRGGSTRSSSPQYLGGSSEKRYQQQTRDRLKAQAWRRGGVRLAVLAVLGFAAWMWGEDVLNLVTRKGQEAAHTVQKTGQSMQRGVDERSGAGFKDDQ